MKHLLPLFLLGALLEAAPTSPVRICEEHLRIAVVENVAKKTFRIVLENTTGQRQEADVYLVVDSSERVEKLKVAVGGKEMAGELLTGEKARKIYEDIVRKQKDPALLETYGANLVRFRIFPIEPNARVEAEVEMIQPLVADGGLVRLTGVAALGRRKLDRAVWEIEIENQRGVGTVFSPSHELDIERRSEKRVRASRERKDVEVFDRLVLYYSLDASGAAVLAHDGHFMMTITPPPGDAEPKPRDIVLAVDVSGSMLENDKIGQARRALRQFLSTLSEKDRFNIVAYSTEATTFRPDFVGVGERAEAERWIEKLSARGGTNVEDALRLAEAHAFRADALPILVLLSDGIATIGERDTDKLAALAKGKARVFCFGVGYDVHTRLLDRLALENGGDRRYVHPQEDVAQVMAAFALKVKAPVLANPVVEIDGAAEIYPKRLADVFEGGQVVLFGRAEGEKTVVLRADGFRMEYRVNFASNAAHAFVPRLWAIQKIDFLMDEIRKRGTDKELVDEIVRLSKEHLIVTPYTSFLVLEDAADALSRTERNFRDSFAKNFTGEEEWLRACNQMNWRGAYTSEAQQRAQSQAIGADASNLCRQVARRNFVLRKDGWIDAGYDDKVGAQEIAFLDEKWFELLRGDRQAAEFLALGRNVTFRCNGQWYRVRG